MNEWMSVSRVYVRDIMYTFSSDIGASSHYSRCADVAFIIKW